MKLDYKFTGSLLFIPSIFAVKFVIIQSYFSYGMSHNLWIAALSARNDRDC